MCTISIYVQVQMTLRYSWVFFGCDENTTPGWTRQFPPLVNRNERWFVDNFPSISVQVNTLSVSLHKPCLLPDPHCTCKPLNRDNKKIKRSQSQATSIISSGNNDWMWFDEVYDLLLLTVPCFSGEFVTQKRDAAQ